MLVSLFISTRVKLLLPSCMLTMHCSLARTKLLFLTRSKKSWTHQVNYLDKVLKHFGMENAIFTATPLPSGWCPSENDGEPDPRHQALYQLMICSLLYIMLGTHPDICYNVTKLAQFISNPSQEHVDKANISVAISLVLAIMCLSFEARLAEVLKVTLTLTGLLIQSNACL